MDRKLITLLKKACKKLGIIDDFIVETTITPYWTWQKYDSGVCKAWGVWGGTVSNYNTVPPFYGYYSDVALPAGLFVGATKCWYMPAVGNGFAMHALGREGTKDEVRWHALATASGSQYCTVWLFVTGMWK